VPLLTIVLLRLLAYTVLVSAVVLVVRAAYQRSSVLGGIVAFGLSGRAVLGTLLFLISYWRWPLFEGAQMGGGFWTLALDGRWYFDAASQAVVSGIGSVPEGSASPFYVQVLALWMHLFGVNPLSAVLFNLACYACSVALILGVATDRRAVTLALAAVTFSPALVIFGTQALKDTLCALLITMALSGMCWWMKALEPERFSWRQLTLGAVLLAAAVYGLGGIRAYLSVFVLAGYGAVVLWSIYRVVAAHDSWGLIGAQVSLGLILWVAFAAGAGAYYDAYHAIIVRTIGSPLQPLAELQTARAGFARSQGATSILTPPTNAGGATATEALNAADRLARYTGDDLASRLRNLALGCAVLFVPISLLKALSIVTFPGGRGLLYITDIDTVVMDVAILASMFFLGSAYRGRRSVPVMLFTIVIALLATIALAYVVTNFGTLFRLRLIVAIPLWLLPVFVTMSTSREGRPSAFVT